MPRSIARYLAVAFVVVGNTLTHYAAALAQPATAAATAINPSGDPTDVLVQLVTGWHSTDPLTRRLAVAALIAEGLRRIIAFFKRRRKLSPQLMTWMPHILALLSVAAVVLDKYVSGDRWSLAIVSGAGPAGAVFLHEFIDKWFPVDDGDDKNQSLSPTTGEIPKGPEGPPPGPPDIRRAA